MSQRLPVSRVINLISEESQRLWTTDESEARRRLLASDVDAVLRIDGSYALVAQDGERVVLARSLDRPMRYFLAKSSDGPVRRYPASAEWPRTVVPFDPRRNPDFALIDDDPDTATDSFPTGRHLHPPQTRPRSKSYHLTARI